MKQPEENSAAFAIRYIDDEGRLIITAEQLAANLAGRPVKHVETLEWFRKHCILKAWDFEKAAAKVRKPTGTPYNRETLKHVFYGFRKAEDSLAPICDAIERYRRNAEPPAPIGGFLETTMFKNIKGYLEWAAEEVKIGCIVGANSCGKTASVTEVTKRDPAYEIVRVPEGGHLSMLVQAMARKRGFGDRQTIPNLANSMIDESRSLKLLAWDEFEQCFKARSTVLGDKTVGYVRRIYDEAGIAMTLIVDPSGYRRIQTVKATDALRKLSSRRLEPLTLPAYYKEDLNLFAAQHFLEPAPESKVTIKYGSKGKEDSFTDVPRRIEDEICGSHNGGLLMWLGLLRRAKQKADKAGVDNSWEFVMQAYALHVAMEAKATLAAGESEEDAK